MSKEPIPDFTQLTQLPYLSKSRDKDSHTTIDNLISGMRQLENMPGLMLNMTSPMRMSGKLTSLLLELTIWIPPRLLAQLLQVLRLLPLWFKKDLFQTQLYS